MGVVFLILKIIGIILLSIIGLTLLMVLCIMLWPFQYRIKAYKDAENFSAAIRLLWLLGIVTLTISYEKEAWLKIKLFGIPIIKLQIWPVEEKAKDEDSQEESAQETSEKIDESNEEKIFASENACSDDDFDECELFTEEDIERDIEEIVNDDSDDAFDKLPFLKKVRAFIDKIKEFILKCRQKCYNIKDTILEYVTKGKKAYKNIRYYIKVIQHPSMEPAVKKLWKNMKKLLKHIRPRQIKAYIEFGSGDPASTMKVYGYYCMIYPFYGKKIKFIPDMENKVLHLDAKVTGYMQMLQMLIIAWSLFIDKDIRRIYRLIRRKQEGKKRDRK